MRTHMFIFTANVSHTLTGLSHNFCKHLPSLKHIQVSINKPPQGLNRRKYNISSQQASLGFTLFGKQVKLILISVCLEKHQLGTDSFKEGWTHKLLKTKQSLWKSGCCLNKHQQTSVNHYVCS